MAQQIKKSLTPFYERFLKLGHQEPSFNPWVDGVINDALMKLEREDYK